jgi:putative ABC transport system ATP-binding protein
MSAALQTRDLSLSFDGPTGLVRAVDGVCLEVRPGEFAAVQGPSGCGKTTLLLAAGGLLHPSSGQVLVQGEDPYALAPEARAAFRAMRIGFVFQQFHLIPYLSVRDNIQTSSLAKPRTDGRERAQELAARFGLEHRLEHVPAALSTGERQRVGLARALFNEPSLLLADEPTGNLDGESAAVVLEHLEQFAAAGGAVLLVTHDPLAARRAQRILRLREGRLLGQG